MSIVYQGEKLRGLEIEPKTGYVQALVERAIGDYKNNYKKLATGEQIKNLSWDDVYIQLLRQDGKEFQAADFMALKFLVWSQESINNQDGRSVFVPADDDFYKDVNDCLRYHFNSLIIYTGQGDGTFFPEIDWSNQQAYQSFKEGSGSLEILGTLKATGSSAAIEMSCGYSFNAQGDELSGLFYHFSATA